MVALLFTDIYFVSGHLSSFIYLPTFGEKKKKKKVGKITTVHLGTNKLF